LLGRCIQKGRSGFEIFGVSIKTGFNAEENLERNAWNQNVNARALGTDFDFKDPHRADPQTVQRRHQCLPKEVVNEFDLWSPAQVVTPKFVVLATLSGRGPRAAEKAVG
jgi:hypothetical protein